MKLDGADRDEHVVTTLQTTKKKIEQDVYNGKMSLVKRAVLNEKQEEEDVYNGKSLAVGEAGRS